jgi:MOSC domain-containing protein YiiM
VTPLSSNGRGELLAVCVGRPREVDTGKRTVRTAIWKQPVEGRVSVEGVNVAGDDQADRTVHGGPDKAVYAYGADDTARWENDLGRALGPGAFGENVWVGGIAVSEAVVGERWEVGTTLLEVSQPRLPCSKLGLRMGDQRFVKRFAHASRPGAYLRIVREGAIAAGDPVTVVSRPEHGVTVRLVADAISFDHERLPELVAAPELAASLRDWVVSRVGARTARAP